MYLYLLVIHNFLRWAVLGALLLAAVTSWQGWGAGRLYSVWDERLRWWANLLSHSQLLLGFSLYFMYSPYVKAYFSKTAAELVYEDWFFAVYHIAMMLAAVVLLTIGGSTSKRAKTDKERFKIGAICYGASLGLIFAAVPWFRILFRGL